MLSLMAGISLSMDAVKVWLDRANTYLKALPSIIKSSTLDAQIAYGCVFTGIVLIFIGFLLLLIL